MITGVVNGGRPTIVGLLSIPRLGLRGFVQFLIDTGADMTLIHPRDMSNLGIQPSRHFAGSATASSGGIGGMAQQYLEPCDLFLQHDDGTWNQISILLRFAMPDRSNAQHPSLLGRDIMHYFTLTFNQDAGLVNLDLNP
jgi:aspartyl protease